MVSTSVSRTLRYLAGIEDPEPEAEAPGIVDRIRQGASAVQQGATDLYNAAAAPQTGVGEAVRGAAQSAYDALPAIRQPATDLYESVQAPMAAHGPGYAPAPLPEGQTPWTQTAGPAIQAGATGLYDAAQDPTNAVETGKRAIQAGYTAAADAYVPNTPAEIATAAVMPPLHVSNVAQAGWNAATGEIGRGLGRAAGTSTDPLTTIPGYGPVSSEDIAGGVAQTVLDPTNLIGAPAAKAAVRAAPRVASSLAEGAVRAGSGVLDDVGRRAAGVADDLLAPSMAPDEGMLLGGGFVPGSPGAGAAARAQQLADEGKPASSVKKWEYLANAGVDTKEDLAETLRTVPMVTAEQARQMLGDRPDYLEPVADFLLTQRQKALNGGMTARDVAKAYYMTLMSMRSAAQNAPDLEAKLGRGFVTGAGEVIPPNPQLADLDGLVNANNGKPLGAIFTEANPRHGGREVRPESAGAAWLWTDDGQRALNAMEEGEFIPEAWERGRHARLAFGSDTVGGNGALRPLTEAEIRAGKVNMTNLPQFVEELNAGIASLRRQGRESEIGALLTHEAKRLQGIGVGKSAFIKQLLGFGDSVTIDAREINYWLSGKGLLAKGDTSRGAQLARASGQWWDSDVVSGALQPRIQQEVERLRDAYPELLEGIAPDDAAHILHHWLWDKAGGSATRHTDVMASQQLASGVGGGRPTVEVLQDRVGKLQRLLADAQARGDQRLADDAMDVLAQTTSELADARNARMALEPRIRSDVGRRADNAAALGPESAEAAMDARYPREAVRAAPGEFSGPVGVPVDQSRGRLNAGMNALLPGPGVRGQLRADAYNCFDDQTEVLTDSGWVPFPVLCPEDQVASYDPASRQIVYGLPLERQVYDFDGEMVAFQARGAFDALVTPNHRMYGQTDRRHPEKHIVADTARELFHRVAADGHDHEYDVTDDELRAVAWVLTDGSINVTRRSWSVALYQRASKAHRIREVLDRLGWEYSESTRTPTTTQVCGRILLKPPEAMTHIRLRKTSRDALMRLLPSNQALPCWVSKLSRRQFLVFLNTWIDGDGSRHAKKPNAFQITGRPDLLEQLQILAVANGCRARFIPVPDRGYARLNVLIGRARVRVKPHGVSRVKYVGKVYCVSTPYETVVVRRNGCVAITGNSAQGGVFGAASESLEAGAEDRETDFGEQLKRGAIGAGMGVLAGRGIGRRATTAAGREAAERVGRLGSGFGPAGPLPPGGPPPGGPQGIPPAIANIFPNLPRAYAAAKARNAADMAAKNITPASPLEIAGGTAGTVSYGAMLGPASATVNFAQGIWNPLWALPKEPLRAGQRAVQHGNLAALREPGEAIKGTLKGLGQVSDAVWDVLRAKGQYAPHPDAPNISQRVADPLGRGVLQALELPGRVWSGLPDAVFGTIAQHTVERRRAAQLATEAGKTGKAWSDWVDLYVKEADRVRSTGGPAGAGTADVLTAGKTAADKAALRSEVGTIGKQVKLVATAGGKPVISQVLAPFFNSQWNAFLQSAERTPAGFVMNRQKGFDKVYDAAVGSALALGVVNYAWNNHGVSGSGPSDRHEREMLIDEGWRPYSTKVDGVWYPNRAFGPGEQLLNAAGEMHDGFAYQKKDADSRALTMDALARVGKLVKQQPYATGYATIADLIQFGPAAAAADLATRVTPFAATARAVGTSLDTREREVDRGANVPLGEEFAQRWQQSTGQRSDLPVAQDVLGREKENPQPGILAFTGRMGFEKEDPIISAFQGAGVSIGDPPDAVESVPLTPDERRRWNTFRGRSIIKDTERLVTSGILEKLPQARQAERLEAIKADASRRAAADLRREVGAAEWRRRQRETEAKEKAAS